MSLERIVIIGSSGAGKSTFAQELGAILGIEVVHLDRYFWQPGWKEYPRKARLQIQQLLLEEKDGWIIEGTYLSSSDNRLKAADTIIFLDIPWFVCLWRVIIRHITMHRKPTRFDLPEGSTDRMTLSSLFKILAFPLRDRRLLQQKIKDIRAQEGQPAKRTIYTFRSRRSSERFLQRLFVQKQRVYPYLAPEAQDK